MTDQCAALHAFADGELSSEDAAAFRAHLATCTACQAELQDILQLQSAATFLPRPLPITRPWHRRPAAVAAVLLPLAAAVLLAIALIPARDAALPAYTMKGPSGFVQSLRGSSTSALSTGTPVFVPDGVLEIRLVPDVEISGQARPAAGLFVADGAGNLTRVRDAAVRATDQGSFALRVPARIAFGDAFGDKALYAVVAPSAGAVDALAGRPAERLDDGPTLRVFHARVEYRPAP